MSTIPTIYADDTDASWDFTVTSRDGENVDWVSPLVAVKGAGYTVAATWLGTASATRVLRVPLVGLAVGNHSLYLRVPNGTDVHLGAVRVRTRT